MAIDFATLALEVKADRAISGVRDFGNASEKATQQAEQLRDKLGRFTSGMNAAGVSSVAGTRGMGAWAAMQAEATGHVGEHAIAIGRLERALASSVGHFVGASSAAELLGAGLLKFSVGTLETVGVLGGLAAVIGLYEKMTEGAREAKKQIDDMTTSLLHQARAAEEATLNGQKNLSLIADINQQTLKGESGLGWRSAVLSILTGRPTISGTDVENHASRLADAASGGNRAQLNVLDKWTEEQEKEIARLKKIDEERAKQQALLVRYNEMMEKAYGGTFDISPAARGARSTWRANGQTMSDDERSALNKQLGIGAIPTVSIPHVGLTDSMTKEQIRQMEVVKQLSEAYQQSIAPFKSLAAAVTDFKQGLQQAATAFGQQFSPGAIGGRLLGKLAGDTSSAGGTAGGAAGLAIGEFVGGPFGAAIGAAIGSRVGNAVENLINGGGAAKRTADRLAADSAHAMALQLNAVTKALSGDQLGGALDALKIGLISSLQAINEALPGKKNEAQRNADRARAAQQEAEQEAKTRKQFAEQQQYAQEDLQVRLLKATGQGSAGDLQAFKNTQAREMQAALDANKDATYINTLRMVENSELLGFLNGTLSDAVRNNPSGWYGSASYLGSYATPRGSGALDAGISRPTLAGGLPTAASTNHFDFRGVTFEIKDSGDPKKTFDGFISVLKQKGAGVTGHGGSLSTALDSLS